MLPTSPHPLRWAGVTLIAGCSGEVLLSEWWVLFPFVLLVLLAAYALVEALLAPARRA